MNIDEIYALVKTVDELVEAANKANKFNRSLNNPMSANEETGEIWLNMGNPQGVPDVIKNGGTFQQVINAGRPGISLAHSYFVQKNHGQVIKAVEAMSKEEQKEQIPTLLLDAIEQHYKNVEARKEAEAFMAEQEKKEKISSLKERRAEIAAIDEELAEELDVQEAQTTA